MRYYILIKKKGSGKWMGVIPAKKNVSLSKLRRTISRSIKGVYTYKIITSAQLKSMLRRMRPSRLRARVSRRSRRVSRRTRRSRRHSRRMRRHVRRVAHRRMRRTRRARRSSRRRKAWFE